MHHGAALCHDSLCAAQISTNVGTRAEIKHDQDNAGVEDSHESPAVARCTDLELQLDTRGKLADEMCGPYKRHVAQVCDCCEGSTKCLGHARGQYVQTSFGPPAHYSTARLDARDKLSGYHSAQPARGPSYANFSTCGSIRVE